MDFKLTKEQELIQKAAHEFAEKNIVPVAEQIEREGMIPQEILKGMADLDLFGIAYPEEYGGTGAGYVSYVLACEQIAKASGSVSGLYSVHYLGTSSIANFGSPEQKEKYLPKAGSGEWISSFAFTEPGTGSDPKQITSVAVKDGDDYVINGVKRFISAAYLPGPIIIFANDSETSVPTAFLVDKFCPGYSVSEPWKKIGIHGSKVVDVYLKDVRVPSSSVLGPMGKGYQVLLAGISFGKVGMCAGSLGGMQAALDASIKYAKEKTHRDGTIAKFPTIQVAIAKMAEKVEACRWLTYRLAWLADNTTDLMAFAKQAALTKAFVAEAGVDVARLAVGVHGSYGLMEDYAVSRMYCDAIISEQTEGVADMQRLITGGSLLR